MARPLPDEPTQLVAFKAPVSLVERAKERAATDERTLSFICIKALQAYLDGRPITSKQSGKKNARKS